MHAQFAAAERAALAGAEYNPAFIGGCAVKLRVQAPFIFTVQ